MISGTAEYERAEKSQDQALNKVSQHDRLLTLFKETDRTGSGSLNEAEFETLLADRGFCDELCDAADLSVRDLQDLFTFLSFQDKDGLWKVNYRDFTEKLQAESQDVRERSVFRLEKEMRLAEKRLQEKLQTIRDDLGLESLHPLQVLQRCVTRTKTTEMHRARFNNSRSMY